GLDRPPSFACVLHPAFDSRKVGVLGETARDQVEQPGADHAARPPRLGDGAHVHAREVLRHLHDLEAFRVGLHQAVLDAVMDHLHEVTRAFRPGVDQSAIVRREVLEQREAVVVDLLLGTDHEAVAVLQAPYAAGYAGVHVVHAFGLDAGAVVERDLPVGVAAVDDDVAGVAQVDELIDRLCRRVAGRHHDPHDSGTALKLSDEVLPAPRPDRALRRMRLHRGLGEVECDDTVTTLDQAQRHIAAHAAQTDDSDFHYSLSPFRG